MQEVVKQHPPEDEVWRTIHLEGKEELPSYRSSPVFARCVSALFSLFHRSAYVWFLLISVLELLDTDKELRMCVVFLAVLVLGFAVKTYHDWIRMKTKGVKDTAQVEVWTGQSLDPVQAKALKTGDIIKLKAGDCTPADVLVLASGRSDQCALMDCFPYYGTPKLNAKVAISETQRILRSTVLEDAVSKLNRLKGIVRVTQPIADIGFFRGQIKLSGYITASALSIDNLALKGCRVCNTPWVLGLVTYVGDDCKCEMNRSTTKREKWSQVDLLLNRYIACVVPVLIITAAVTAALQPVLGPDFDHYWSLYKSYLLLYSQAVPASLYLLLDLARVAHIVFFSADLNASPEHIWPRNFRLAEAFGQVEYILTDKTGTLSANDITLKMVRVGQIDYFRCNHQNELHRQLCLTPITRLGESHVRTSPTDFTVNKDSEDSDDFCGFTEVRSLVSHSRSPIHTRLCESMALCNAVEVAPDRTMKSQSREEMALINGALDLGVDIHEKTEESCSLTIGDTFKSYSILAVTDFKPSLRRMRVLVQRQESLEGLLIIKGAADTMTSLLFMDREEARALELKIAELTRKRIILFMYGIKHISEAEMAEITERLDYLSMTDSKGRKVEAMFRELEKDCVYLGLAGLHDPIVTSTAVAVRELLDSGKKVWVLSGDRESRTNAAAMEIGLLTQNTPIARLSNLDSESLCKLELANAIRYFILKESLSQDASPVKEDSMLAFSPEPHQPQTQKTIGFALERRSLLNSNNPPLLTVKLCDIDPNFSLCIDGVSFRSALLSEDSREMLAALLFTAKTVLFHSMLPHQKAMAVRFVRENFVTRPVTMAVGDEVNDISMIQEADVGIAVKGRYSREVGGISDLEVSTFGAIATLVLRQGNVAYRSVKRLVTWWLYASTLPVCLSLIYAFFSLCSGTPIMQPEIFNLYILLTAVYTLISSLLDSISLSQSTDSEPLKSPSTLTLRTLFANLSLSTLHSCIIFTFLYLSNLPETASSTYTGCYETLSASACLMSTLVVLGHIWLQTHGSSVVTVVSAGIMLGTLMLAYSEFTEDIQGADLRVILGKVNTILGEFGAVGGCCIASHAIRTFTSTPDPLFPSSSQSTNRETSLPSTTSRHQSYPSRVTTLHKIYRKTPYWSSLHSHSNYKMHEKWLHFSSPVVESEYQQEMMMVHLNKAPGVGCALALGVYLVYSSVVMQFYVGKVVVYSAYILSFCVSPFLRWNLELVTSIQFLLLCGKFAMEMHYEYTDILSFILPACYSLYIAMDWRHNVGLLLCNLVTVFYTVLAFKSYQWDESAWSIATLVVMSVYSLSVAQFNYLNEQETRAEFRLLKLTKLTVDRAKDVLHCLFPSFVLRPVWKGELPFALDQNHVTVLFCDLCDFDMICSELSSQELMGLLDDLFKKLDDMCETYGMSKIETVGKTYLACAGLKDRENELAPSIKIKNHARRACEMAFEIMTLMKEYTVAMKPLQANIGINSGPVIAGVVGSEKPQFALIGDTVNTASRMSSTAPCPSTIQISAETFESLGTQQYGIDTTSRMIPVKGKGDMQVYIITESNSQVPTLTSSNLDYSTRRTRGPESTTFSSRKEIFGNWRFSTMMDQDHFQNQLAVRTATHMQREKEEEIAFKAGALHRQSARLLWGGWMMVVAVVVETALWMYVFEENREMEVWPLLAVFLVLVVIMGKFTILVSLRLFPWMWLLLGLFASISVTHSGVFYEEQHQNHTILIQLFLLVYFQTYGGLFFKHSLVFFLTISLYWTGLIGTSEERLRRIHALLSFFPILLLATFFSYKQQQNSKIYSTFELRVAKQMEKTNNIIGKMMPPHVYESLLHELHRADVLSDVTLLFADIVGFTALSSHKSPREMVHLLSELFSGFDDAAAKNSVYKVHTIGDCYVAMGYTGKPGGRDKYEECLNVIRLAYDILEVIDVLNRDAPDLGLGMRIGIHTGKVIAGITGAKIVRYDIYGPDVLIANKMESNGCNGRIHISDITKAMLEEAAPTSFTYEFNKQVDIKSISVTRQGYYIQRVTATS